MAYRFFLSYARDETQQDEVAEFFDDLVREISPQLGRTGETFGFLDRESIDPSSVWGEAIGEALRTCKILVCLTTEAYIDSPYCGKELEAFRARVLAAGKEDANLIIAVRWAVNRRSLHPLLQSLQYDHRDLPELYATKGLLRLKRMADPGYYTVTRAIADLIVARSEIDPLPPADVAPVLNETPNAFQVVPDGSVRSSGPKHAKFVYLAATSKEARAARNSCGAYGDEGYFWCPFCPPTSETVGKTAYSVAADLDLRPAEIPVGPDLRQQLEAASESNTPVAIVVDPWSLEIKKYRELARSVDSFNSPTCAVFVPWNAEDDETKEKAPRLLSLVRDTFRAHIATTKEMYYQEGLASMPEFRQRLRDAIHQMRFATWNDGTAPSNPVNNEIKLQTLSVVDGESRDR